MDHRRKLLRTLASSLILYEKIQTYYANGKVVKGYVEKTITQAKDNSLHSRRLLLAKLSPMAAKKAIEVLGPKFKSRAGGYTRLTRLNDQTAGNSKVLLELVD